MGFLDDLLGRPVELDVEPERTVWTDRKTLRHMRDAGNPNAGIPPWAAEKFPFAAPAARRERHPKYAGLLILQVIRESVYRHAHDHPERYVDDFGDPDCAGVPGSEL